MTDSDSLLVTSADQIFLWATVAYILVYLVIHIARIVNEEQDSSSEPLKKQAMVPVYNVIVASLQLTATRFYSAAETPYNLVLITILACRGWYVWQG